ncbi:MAG: hypothetical protein ACR2NZ_24390 [Rubripirellula sp.]
MMRFTTTLLAAIVSMANVAYGDETQPAPDDRVSIAIERSLRLLESTSAATAEQRKCFTCHGQAMPVIALVEARKRGFSIDESNLELQLDHTDAHLRRGRKSYLDGKGQGGGVDTAGYALWTLEAGGRSRDETISSVLQYLVSVNSKLGYWKCKSDRPPSESSHFTTTYLALRAIHYFGDTTPAEEERISKASAWLHSAKPVTTEDKVFHLRSLHYLSAEESVLATQADSLVDSQRDDGGWAQKDDMESDAYATASVLVALLRCGHPASDHTVFERGLAYLLDRQAKDGSWRVETRSKPFQKYFESSFPYAEDQFISASATAWSTLALLLSLPAEDGNGEPLGSNAKQSQTAKSSHTGEYTDTDERH